MRAIIVALVVAAVVALTGLPAAAQSNFQTWLQIRYWGTGLSFGNPPPTVTDSGSAWGGTLRFDSLNSPWSFSGRFDSVNASGTLTGFTSGSLWDFNVHYRFGPTPDMYLGLFAGYGGVSISGATATGNGSGVRVGAEFLSRQPGGWYFVGEGAFGSGWNTSLTGFTGVPQSNTTDYRFAVGYEAQGGWGVEVGWRQFVWRIPTGSGCPAAPGCETRFSGVTVALTLKR